MTRLRDRVATLERQVGGHITQINRLHTADGVAGKDISDQARDLQAVVVRLDELAKRLREIDGKREGQTTTESVDGRFYSRGFIFVDDPYNPSELQKLRFQLDQTNKELERVEGDLNQAKAEDGEYYRRGKQVLMRRTGKRTDKPVLRAENARAAIAAVTDLNKQRAA